MLRMVAIATATLLAGIPGAGWTQVASARSSDGLVAIDGLSVVSPGEAEAPYLTGDWAGLRSKAEARGIIVAPTLTIDYGKNLVGGVDTAGSGLVRLFDLTVTVDLEKAVAWQGGTLNLTFQDQYGQSPSDEVGDYQGVSNIAADGRTQLSEVWFRQTLFGGKLAAKVGKIDAGWDFAYAEHASAFLNYSTGYPLSNLYLPTYPDPAFGGDVFFHPTEQIYAGVGVFDGALLAGVPTGSRGPRTLPGDPSGLFLIGEVGGTWALRAGTLAGPGAGRRVVPHGHIRAVRGRHTGRGRGRIRHPGTDPLAGKPRRRGRHPGAGGVRRIRRRRRGRY